MAGIVFEEAMALDAPDRLRLIARVARSVNDILSRLASSFTAREIEAINDLCQIGLVCDQTVRQFEMPVRRFEPEYGPGDSTRPERTPEYLRKKNCVNPEDSSAAGRSPSRARSAPPALSAERKSRRRPASRSQQCGDCRNDFPMQCRCGSAG